MYLRGRGERSVVKLLWQGLIEDEFRNWLGMK